MTTDSDIAIVGAAGRFPGARSIEALWELVLSGETGVLARSDEELLRAGVDPDLLRSQDYVKFSGVIEDVDCFDADFFDIGPRDAAIMDPQHRHFLECAWEALEYSGHVPQRFDGAIGVYAGSGMNTYLMNNLLTNPSLVEELGMFLLRHTSNDKDFLATTVSYRLNLRGPSINVQTACSTSLVAVHLATQALLNGECDIALAGGATIDVPVGQGFVHREGEILSKDGRCRAFDVNSSGTVLTCGVGVVALRRLADALADRDTILAVIKGSAVNNDGAAKMGYLAPGVEGHSSVIAEALGVAGLCPRDLQYIETHGTGTSLGDAVEIAALGDAFRQFGDHESNCRLGSIKPTIGHADTAAGVAGLIKTAMALQHQVLPPLANFSAPNPAIGISATPFTLSAEPAAWVTDGAPRRAGVSSLGVGGTNAHVVLEEHVPEAELSGTAAGRLQVLPLSARSPEALMRSAGHLADWLEAHEPNLADVAFTLQEGRAAFEHRAAVVAASVHDAADALRHLPNAHAAVQEAPDVVFMFPGGGSQYPNMGRALYESEPAFRAAVDEALEALSTDRRERLRQLLYTSPQCEPWAAEALSRPSLQLPAIFITEYALARLWQSWGVQPTALIGHSLGECTAACLAGVFSVRDALALVSLRASMMERVPDAGMLSVGLAEGELLTILPANLSLAAVNTRDLTVVSGTNEAVDDFEGALTGRDVPVRRIKINGAVHSALLDPYLPEFRGLVSKIPFAAPAIPYVSNVTGTWVRAEDAQDPEYWVRHLREPVRFFDGISTLLDRPNTLLVELGPGNTLSTLVKQNRPGSTSIASLPHPLEEVPADEKALRALGDAWGSGVEVTWGATRTGSPRRIPLPTYPFARDRHWIEPGSHGPRRETTVSADLADWFAQPTWTNLPLLTRWTDHDSESWLVFDDGSPLSRGLIGELRRHSARVAVATRGRYQQFDADRFSIDPRSPNDFIQLFGELDAGGRPPTQILFLWSTRREQEYAAAVEAYFEGPLFLAQAIAARPANLSASVTVVTEGGFGVNNDGWRAPWGALALGPVRVLPRERAGVTTRIVDIEPMARRAGLFGRLKGASTRIDAVLDEAASNGSDSLVALRGRQRFVQRLERCKLEATADALTPGGVYVITGAFGGIGREVATYLASQYGAKLVLSSRTTRETVSRAAQSARERLVGDLQLLGSEVHVIPADVTNRHSVEVLVSETARRFGHIDGVIHAAGVLDDGLLQMKSLEAAHRVIAPKVVGAMNLLSALQDHQGSVLILFSSTSAYLGLEGQVDYTAANAFTDMLACGAPARGPRVLSLAWGMWNNTGMAGTDESGALVARFDIPATDWRFEEHRLSDGTPVLPGTAYIQAIHEALGVNGRPFEIGGLSLVAPITCSEDGAVVEVRLRGETVSVGSPGAPSASGRVLHSEEQESAIALESILIRCSGMHVEVTGGGRQTDQERFVRFGPRWRSLRDIWFGESEAIASLALPPEFVDDLLEFPFHPALLDMASGFGLPLVPGYNGLSDFYVPSFCGQVKLLRPLKPEVRAWIRLKPDSSRDQAIFDVTVTDSLGNVLVILSDFCMLRTDSGEAFGAGLKAPLTSARESSRRPPLVPFSARIQPSEGPRLFERALKTPRARRLIISPLPIPDLERRIEEAAEARTGQAAGRIARPRQASDYEPPRNDIERMLASTWADLLGIDRVGINDSFFDLGGHSLIAVRMFTRVRHQFGVQLALASLFEAPTVAALAAVIRDQSSTQPITDSDSEAATLSASGWSPLVPIQTKGTKCPLFFVHGMYGNVLNLYPLSKSLGTDQPFYGLQQVGLNGVDEPHSTIERMAECYIREIRRIQPTGPYQVGGYSGGGLVAFEIAHQLRAAGEQVSMLAMLDTPGPRLVDEGVPARLWRFWGRVRSGGRHYLDRRAKRGYRQLRLLLHIERTPTTIVVDNEAFTVMLGDHMLRAQRRYKFRPIDVRISLFRAETRDSSDGFLPRDFTWGSQTTAGVTVADVPGTHVTMCLSPNVERLAHALAAQLDPGL